jgi:hypothetical protein
VDASSAPYGLSLDLSAALVSWRHRDRGSMSLKVYSCGDGPWRRIRDVSDCRGRSENVREESIEGGDGEECKAISQWLGRNLNPAVDLSM